MYFGLLILYISMEKTLIHSSKPALVLSGGGMKAAAFHIGVGLALEQSGLHITQKNTKDLNFGSFIGSSAGSVIASFYAAGYSPQDVIYAFTQGKHQLDVTGALDLEPKQKLPPLRYRDIFSLNDYSLPSLSWLSKLKLANPTFTGGPESYLKKFVKFNGFFSTEKLGTYFEKNVFKEDSTSFKNLKKDLFIVATFLDEPEKAIFTKHEGPIIQTDHSKSPYINTVSVSKALSASVALPVIFSPVKIQDNVFFDGEVRDSLNSHIALDHLSDLVVVSYSMQPYKHTPEFGSLNKYGLPVIINQAIYQLIQQKIINHKRHNKKVNSLLNDIEDMLFSELPKEKANKIFSEIQKKYCPERGSTVIYIHPSSTDHEMFFADHLSLSTKVLNKIVTIGFKSAMESLRAYKFKKATK